MKFFITILLFVSSVQGSLRAMDRPITEIDRPDAQGYSPLARACLAGDAKLATELVLAGADACAQNKFGEVTSKTLVNRSLIQTPLHCAVQGKNIEIIDLLLQHSADINSVHNPHGNTPLHIAAWFGYRNIAEHLLKNGACINIANNAGSMPIHSAVWNDQSECLQILLAYGADCEQMSLKQQNLLGHTPLSLAAKAGSLKCLKILFAQLREKNVLDKHLAMKCSGLDGYTPLQIAASTLQAQSCWDLICAGSPFSLDDLATIFDDYKPLVNFVQNEFPRRDSYGYNRCELCKSAFKRNDLLIVLTCYQYYHAICFEDFSIKEWMKNNPNHPQRKYFETEDEWFKDLQKHKRVCLPGAKTCPGCPRKINMEDAELFVIN